MPDLHPVAVTDATFGHEVEQQKGLIVVDFWATWCGPCHMVAPILEQLAGEYQGKLKVVKLDVDANQQTAMRFNVRSRSEEHTSELQSLRHLVCRLLLEKKKKAVD